MNFKKRFILKISKFFFAKEEKCDVFRKKKYPPKQNQYFVDSKHDVTLM